MVWSLWCQQENSPMSLCYWILTELFNLSCPLPFSISPLLNKSLAGGRGSDNGGGISTQAKTNVWINHHDWNRRKPVMWGVACYPKTAQFYIVQNSSWWGFWGDHLSSPYHSLPSLTNCKQLAWLYLRFKNRNINTSLINMLNLVGLIQTQTEM